MTYPDYVLDREFTAAVQKALGIGVATHYRAELSLNGKVIGHVKVVYGIKGLEEMRDL